MRLLRMLSIVSRRRWPDHADPAPAIGVPPPKKKAAPPAADAQPSRDEPKEDQPQGGQPAR
jgi:coenzyme F420 hydrogenase subunit beta